MVEQVIHMDLHKGGVDHIPFTRENWEKALRDPRVVMRWTHRLGPCPGKQRSKCPDAVKVAKGPLLLVDAMYLAYRSHFAFRQLQSPIGKPTGTYYGFLRTVLDLAALSERLLFCWDGGVPGDTMVPGWRRGLYPAYKAGRKPTADKRIIWGQLATLKRALSYLGYGSVGVPGLEADDLIGIFSTAAQGNVLVYSSDHDLYQLLEGERVQMLRPAKEGGKFVVITQRSVEAKYDIRISEWARYLALGGDRSDNVRPLSGVGPKRALALVQDGLKPDLAFADQPLGVRKAHRELATMWGMVQRAYRVVHIPRSFSDSRLVGVLGRGSVVVEAKPDTYVGPALLNRDAQMKRFLAFCADYGLREFVWRRWDFYHVPTKG